MKGSGLRVTGGQLGGRRLRVPARGLRPTADRVREALFARLGDLSECAVLDLYAGTGALGAEAASRGARSVVFVERAARCAALLRENLRVLGLAGVTRVVCGDAPRVVRQLGRQGERFDLVLLDPPYASEEVPRVLEALLGSGVLAPGALVVVEHHRRQPVSEPPGLALLDARRYGDTVVTRLVAGDPRGAQGGLDPA
jgi:16S rRNA (guanine966-N2)-methyltransferase